MNTTKIKVEVEVPDGKYCMEKVWDEKTREATVVYKCNFCSISDVRCNIFNSQLDYSMYPNTALRKLPACRDAERA